MNMKNNSIILTPEEKAIVSEELSDIKDHFETLVKDKVFNNSDIEKEEVINRVNVIDNVLRKLS